MVNSITLPHDWTPRHYQLGALRKFDAGIKRHLLIWPRRAGKDSFAINLSAKSAHQRVGSIFHFLPTARQGRKVIWDGIDKQGRRIIDQAMPKELRSNTVNDEMQIKLKCGSMYQVVGSDNFDSIVGTNPVGCVFSEYALSDPRAWDYVRPILAENGGWACFITTPRGKNHAYEMYRTNKDNPLWNVSHLTCEDTGHISLEAIEEERRSGMSEARIRQEFYCDFEVADLGQIYADIIEELEKGGRVGSVPYDPRYPVHTFWDLGHRDATAIWFVQYVNMDIHVIDYLEERRGHVGHFVGKVRDKPYSYARHVTPHDTERFEFGAGTTILEAFRQHGINPTIAPKLTVDTGIKALRVVLRRCKFDVTRCHHLLRALKAYRYEENEEDRTVSNKPKHDWSSHAADAGRYMAVTPQDFGVNPSWASSLILPSEGDWSAAPKIGRRPPMAEPEYDPLAAWR